MKDEHDKHTGELPDLTIERRAPRAPMSKPFNYFRPLTFDAQSQESERPDCAQLRPVVGIAHATAHFVPVAFVAKDWSVTPRRIRALLTAGRLAGRAQSNGYWEVQYPYIFAIGTRGPSLKRQQRPPKRPRLVVDNTVGKSA